MVKGPVARMRSQSAWESASHSYLASVAFPWISIVESGEPVENHLFDILCPIGDKITLEVSSCQFCFLWADLIITNSGRPFFYQALEESLKTYDTWVQRYAWEVCNEATVFSIVLALVLYKDIGLWMAQPSHFP